MKQNRIATCISAHRRKIPYVLFFVVLSLTLAIVFSLGSIDARVSQEGFGDIASSSSVLTSQPQDKNPWQQMVAKFKSLLFMSNATSSKLLEPTTSASPRTFCEVKRQPHPDALLSGTYRKLPTCMMPALHQRRPTAEDAWRKKYSKEANEQAPELPLLNKIFPFSTTFLRPPYYGQKGLTFNGSFAPQDFFVPYDESEWIEYCETISGNRTVDSTPETLSHKSKLGQAVIPDKIVFAFIQNRAEWEEETIIWQLTPSLFIMDRHRSGDGPGVTVPLDGQGGEDELKEAMKNSTFTAAPANNNSHPIIFSFHFAFDGEMKDPHAFLSDIVETIACIREHLLMWYDESIVDHLISDSESTGFMMVSDVVTNHEKIKRSLDVYEALRLGDWAVDRNENTLVNSQIRRQHSEAFDFKSHPVLAAATKEQLLSVLSGSTSTTEFTNVRGDLSPREQSNQIHSAWKGRIPNLDIDKRDNNRLVDGPRASNKTTPHQSTIPKDALSPRDGKKYYNFGNPDNDPTPRPLALFVLPDIKTIISVSDEGASASDTSKLLVQWRRANLEKRSFLRQYSTHRVASLSTEDKVGIELVMLGFRHFRRGILTEGRVVGTNSYSVPYLGGLAPTEKFVVTFKNSVSSLRLLSGNTSVASAQKQHAAAPAPTTNNQPQDQHRMPPPPQPHGEPVPEDPIVIEKAQKTMQFLQKKLLWSFMGGMKSDREEMIRLFRDLSSSTNTRHECCSGDAIEPLYKRSMFVPIGRGYVTLDCFRIYETAAAGALPIIVGGKKELYETFRGFASGGEYGEETLDLNGGGFGGGSGEDTTFVKELPPFVYATNWETAAQMAKELLLKPHFYRERQIKLTQWFMNMYWFMQERMVYGREGGMRRRYLANIRNS